MRVAVLNETNGIERRVALVPSAVSKLVEKGVSVLVQAGAGQGAFFADAEYSEAGAEIFSDVSSPLSEADVILRVTPLKLSRDGADEVGLLKRGQVVVGMLNPYGNIELVRVLAEKGVSAFALEVMPRISRAQSMDALSSQANVAGYKAVLLAASKLGKFLPFLTTAAGTIRPAKVLVVGAGVAGLQAIATARRLGAEVEAFDIRPAVKEEVQSLGAKFIEVELEEKTEAKGGYAREVSEEAKKREREILAEHIALADVVITTAQVPGKRAPVLITEQMVSAMRAGSVIVDIPAEQGGNCELTQPGKEVTIGEVTIIGPINLPSTVPVHASQMYSKNLISFLDLIIRDGQLNLNFEDEVIAGSCITHNGEIRNENIGELAVHS